jgi:flagellar hook-associated protein 1 FlgK
MVGVLSNEGYMSKAIAESQAAVVLNIETQRQSVVGVSQEEELSNMIKFKNAYDASSRYINAVAEMIDTLINRVGNS